MAKYDTLTQAMEALKQQGYTSEFAAQHEFLVDSGTQVKLKSDEFLVDEFYRFEGTSDPGDEVTLYAISTPTGKKGVFVSAQGTYANEVSPELMAKFNLTDRPAVNTDGAVQPITPDSNS